MLPNIARPPSAVHSATGFLGLAGFLASLTLIITFKLDPRSSTFWVLLATGLPMLGFEIFLAWRTKSFFSVVGAGSPAGQAVDWLRVMTKIAGFALAWILLWLWFEWAPVYRRPDYFFTLIHIDRALPFLVVAGSLYVVWCDRHMADPHDGAWHAGRALLSPISPLLLKLSKRPQDVPKTNWLLAVDFGLGWFIKGFFLVFLISAMPGNIEALSRFPEFNGNSLARFVFWASTFLFTIDIVIAIVGYASTFKPLNAHIRSVNPTVLGWAAALVCYPPFSAMSGFNLIDYKTGGTLWDLWLKDANLWLQWTWGLGITACLLVYTWATVAFGIRFSNLTNRGILSHGPYRLMRHPAYVAKNIFWWMIHVPWINQLGTTAAIKCCLMLAIVNMIYALRAWTEEQHLSQDPDYLQYKAWIRSRSLWQRLRD